MAAKPATIDRPLTAGKVKGKSGLRPAINSRTAPEVVPPVPGPEARRAPPVADDGRVSNPNWIAAPPTAPLVAPQLPPVVKTSTDNRFDRRIITIAALVLGAVLLIAGIGYKLIAGSDDGKLETQTPPPAANPAP